MPGLRELTFHESIEELRVKAPFGVIGMRPETAPPLFAFGGRLDSVQGDEDLAMLLLDEEDGPRLDLRHDEPSVAPGEWPALLILAIIAGAVALHQRHDGHQQPRRQQGGWAQALIEPSLNRSLLLARSPAVLTVLHRRCATASRTRRASGYRSASAR